ncbi:MAG TPA: hypothetical protein V6D17_20575 [Candidatus Obscuribacterales bacterium]
MSRPTASMIMKVTRATALACLVTAGLWLATPQGSLAQYAQPLPPYQPVPEGAPPPPGDGPTPAPLLPGDVQAPPAVPSGTADNTPGHWFPVGNGRDRTVVRVYRQINGNALGQSRGEGMVMTIRPDQLSQDQIGRINGILGINMLSGEQSIDVQASPGQLEQINEVLAPYPPANNQGGRKFIDSDTPAQGYPKPGDESIYDFQGPLPTVRTFCRYLVILGVVSATVWMALAMYSMVMGHPYGGSRAIGTAAGLMLLLMGYTIWKVVQMNTFNAMSDLPAVNRSRPNDAQVSDAYLQGSTVPGTPGPQNGGFQRSGIPVVPLGNAKNP